MCAYRQARGDENQPPYFCVCPTQFYFHLMEVIVINVAITASSWMLKQFAINLLAKLHTIFIYYEEWDNSLSCWACWDEILILQYYLLKLYSSFRYYSMGYAIEDLQSTFTHERSHIKLYWLIVRITFCMIGDCKFFAVYSIKRHIRVPFNPNKSRWMQQKPRKEVIHLYGQKCKRQVNVFLCLLEKKSGFATLMADWSELVPGESDRPPWVDRHVCSIYWIF